MQAHANFTYPIPEMDLLNALDDAALEQIIFAEKESDYEVYVDHPSNTVSINPKRCGGGSKWPTGQEIACHFSQDHAMVTKILDFIHKHLN